MTSARNARPSHARPHASNLCCAWVRTQRTHPVYTQARARYVYTSRPQAQKRVRFPRVHVYMRALRALPACTGLTGVRACVRLHAHACVYAR
jgi:hypothetical protein